MKKIVAIILIGILTLVSCSNPLYNVTYADFKVYDENIYEELLSELDNVELPKFTKEEQDAIDYYKENGLNVGQFVYEFYYSVIDGEAVGINEYTMMIFEKLLDIEINTTEIQFSEFQDKLLDKSIDIVPAIYYTSVSEDGINVTESYSYDNIYLYSKRDEDIQTIQEISGMTIGLPSFLTYIVEEDLEILKEKNIDLEIIMLPSQEATIEAYENGEIDYILSNISMYFLQNGYNADEVDRNILAKKFRFAYNESVIDEDFISVIEKVFSMYEVKENIKNAKRGVYQLLLGKGLLFTEEEKEYIEYTKNNPIIFENTQFAKPIAYYNQMTGDYDGAIPEVWRRISLLTGLNYKSIPPSEEKFYKVLDKIENNKIDGTMFKILVPTDERFYHTQPIFRSKFVLVGTEKSPYIHTIKNLNNYVVGAVKNTTANKILANNYGYENINNNFDNVNDLLDGLYNNEVDYVILSEYIYNEFYYKEKNWNLTLIDTFNETSESISVFNKDNDNNRLLVSIANKTMYAIDKEEIDKQYLTTKFNLGILLQNLQSSVVIIFAGIFLIVVGVIYITIQAIKKRKLTEDILNTDSLTKAKSRHAFREKYKNGFINKETVLYLNIDNFKIINDTFGHNVGDVVLKKYTELLKSFTNAEVYRFGNDEFVVVFQAIHIDDKTLDDIINKCTDTKVVCECTTFNLSIEVSVVILDTSILKESDSKYNEILALCDYTMHLVKKDKKRNYRFCDDILIQKQKKIHNIEEKIQKPLDTIGIIPYFQPIFDMYNNKIVAFETLARWKDKDILIYPDEFIPAIERNGNIEVLDLHMFECALSKMEEWLQSGLVDDSIYITSNFSSNSINESTIDKIEEIYNKHNVSKNNFVIEITESFFADKEAIRLVNFLKEHGFKIAIDDFSAGHSSLSSLVKINMDYTKIDKELVEHKANLKEYIETKGAIVLRNVIKLVSELNSDIIVEGVEDQEVIDLLKEIGGVRKIQGYYYSKPLDEVDIKKIIIKYNHKGQFEN